jgi:Tol biopolymer transport system component
VQPASPAALDRIVKTCLAKDPEDRWQSAADVRRELRWVAKGRRPRRRRQTWSGAAAASASPGSSRLCSPRVLAELLFSKRLPRTEKPGAVHSYLLPPEKTTFRLTGDDGAPVMVSPDGKRVVFGASGRLWVQSLETGAVSPLPSKSGGKFPFWSPDSRTIGFFADGKLKTIDASGGPIQTICDAPNPRGGAWNSEGVIVFSPDIRTGLFRVPASGGKPAPVTVLDPSKHTTHRWPEFLPDGRHLIYLAANHNEPKSENTGIYLASLDGKENRRLFASDGSAQWAPGWILSVRESSLMARPFDDRRNALQGEAVRVAEGVHLDAGVWRGVFSTSRNGVLAYQSALSQVGTQMTWFDRSGKALETVGERRPDYWPRLSPDGRRVAVAQGDPNGDVWVYEIGRGTRIRLTTNAMIAGSPAWSPDGSQIAYVSQQGPPKGFGFYVAPSNGAPPVREVGSFSERVEPTDWSRDGKYILYGKGNLGATDIWALPVAEPSKAFPLVRSEWHEGSGQFSPDGRWVAYVSLESGRAEIYVTPFPSGGARWQVSTEGGNLPRWRGDGRELYYLSPDDEIMAASVGESTDRFEVTKVLTLFRVGLSFWRTDQYPYDVAADGQRFLIATIGDAGAPRVSLVTDWTAALRK